MTISAKQPSWSRLISPGFIRKKASERGIAYCAKRFGYYAMLIPLAVVLRLVLLTLRPVVHIRFGRLLSYSLGILGHSIELYQCARDAGMHPPRSLDIWYHFDNNSWYLPEKTHPRKGVSNEQLLTMWRRVFHVNDAVRFLDRLNRMLPPGDQTFITEVPHPWDDHALLDRFPCHLSFTKTEEKRGLAGLEEMGIGRDDPVVCFDVRDSTYLDQARPWNSNIPNSVREWYHQNSTVQNYELAARTLGDLGYFVLRMGKHVKDPFIVDHPRVIDYASEYWSDFMDIFLPYHCTFFMGQATGGASLPLVFRKPMAFINFLPYSEIAYCQYSEGFLIPKTYYSNILGRKLTIRETVQNGLTKFQRGDPGSLAAFQALDLEFIQNTPEEIQDAALELHGRLHSSEIWTAEDQGLQERFWAVLREFPEEIKIPEGPLRINIGARFFRRNQDLLD